MTENTGGSGRTLFYGTILAK